MNTACTKCKATDGERSFSMGRFGIVLTTGYRCKHCGHWNDLTRRKGWKEYKTEWYKQRGK